MMAILTLIVGLLVGFIGGLLFMGYYICYGDELLKRYIIDVISKHMHDEIELD